MPRTRTDTDRDTKVAEILEAADRRLRDGGYDALSVAAIARELGLAQNAVYWYFPSKDHLFVAAVERMLRDVAARKPPSRGGVARQVTWFADQLHELQHVRAALYERARSSEVVARFAADLNATWRRMLANALSDSVPEAERPMAVEALIATIQGVLLQDHGAAERRRIIGFAVERLTRGREGRDPS
jgi:TetR/AcrR family transcriptional regulator, repressor of the mexAB-oprM multidrug resistance operon